MEQATTVTKKGFSLHVGVVVFFILFLLLCLQLFSPFLIKQLNAYNLWPKPETFTELYFENHQLLPSQVASGQVYSFSFTTHNEEYKAMNYPYTVSFVADGKTTLLQKGSFSLLQDGKKTVAETFTAGTFLNRAKVVVTLVNKNQSIDFWITE